MEHKLILGGEIYLPFARSRIKAMRATGLSYASQQFEIDGSTIKVRIEPGHEYIRIEGGQTPPIHMDSGVVDLVTWFENEPTRYNTGVLHETTGVSQYLTPFVATDPVSNWRVNPEPSSFGQLAGSITLGTKREFAGRAPYNAQPAQSFRPATIPNSATNPAGWQPDPSDDALVAKKAIADYCPASIFTGKTRLYVQALYGRPIYDADKLDSNGSITSAGKPVDSIVSFDPGIGGTPSILLAPYVRQSDTQTYQPVVLTTGAGVFLDPQTGKHWLLSTGYDGLVVYPLIAEPRAEPLRRLLRTPAPQKPALSELDREHLEAYILSTCRPDAKNVAYLPFAAPVNTWSLGYSWHWNWTGLTADIVTNEEFWQERVVLNDFYAMRSTHRRLAVVPTQVPGVDGKPATTTFSVSVSIVEGPKDWSVERVLWCIAEPDWARGVLLKTTPKYSKLFACNAPFYAFYIRDELKVCRVRVTATGTTSTRETSPSFDGSASGDFSTIGTDAGYGETRSFSGTYYTATFSCGGDAIGNLHAYRGESGTLDEVSPKSPGSITWGTPAFYREASYSWSYGDPRNAGYPIAGSYTASSSVNGWTPVVVPMSYTHTSSVLAIAHPNHATLVVPHKDAEAFYIEGHSERVKSLTGKTAKTLQGGQFMTRGQYQEVDYFTGEGGPPVETQDLLLWAPAYLGATITSTTNPPDTTETTVLSDVSVLISHAGATPAVLTNDLFFARFHDFEYEEVPSNFNTVSGTSVASPVVISALYIDPAIGAPVAPAMPALVGWV